MSFSPKVVEISSFGEFELWELFMGASQRYRQYPESVKMEIMNSKNPHRFPELNIPRTTALYWIKQSAKIKKSTSAFIESERVQKLQQEVIRQRSLLNLVLRVRGIFFLRASIRKVHFSSKEKTNC
jgi:hypothetical protein